MRPQHTQSYYGVRIFINFAVSVISSYPPLQPYYEARQACKSQLIQQTFFHNIIADVRIIINRFYFLLHIKLCLKAKTKKYILHCVLFSYRQNLVFWLD